MPLISLGSKMTPETISRAKVQLNFLKVYKTYLPVCTEDKGTLGSKKTPNPFSVSFLTTHFQG